MKLLVFDKEYNHEDGDCITILNKSLKDYSITLTTDIIDANTLFENSQFDIVIIDFTTDEGSEFLKYVIKKEPSQKVITIGYELSQSEKLGCDFCDNNYKRRRLVKPISVVDLYRMVVNFDDLKCEYKNKFNDIEVIIKQLLFKYDYFKFDKNSSLISCGDSSSQILKQYLNLINDLNTYKVEHQIIDDKTIKVLSI